MLESSGDLARAVGRLAHVVGDRSCLLRPAVGERLELVTHAMQRLPRLVGPLLTLLVQLLACPVDHLLALVERDLRHRAGLVLHVRRHLAGLLGGVLPHVRGALLHRLRSARRHRRFHTGAHPFHRHPFLRVAAPLWYWLRGARRLALTKTGMMLRAIVRSVVPVNGIITTSNGVSGPEARPDVRPVLTRRASVGEGRGEPEESFLLHGEKISASWNVTSTAALGSNANGGRDPEPDGRRFFVMSSQALKPSATNLWPDAAVVSHVSTTSS